MVNLRAVRDGGNDGSAQRQRRRRRRGRSGKRGEAADEELPWTTSEDDAAALEKLEPFVYGPDESAAYVGFRMGSAVVLTQRLLGLLAERDPSFVPTSVIDFGAGPASSLWAVDEVWPDAMQSAVCVEPSQSMATAGRMLAKGLRSSVAVEWVPSINRIFPQPGARGSGSNAAPRQAQLVIAANVLGELPSDAARGAAIELLWRTVAPNGVLLVSEPGSPWGSQVVRRARQALLDAHDGDGSLGEGTRPRILAPCPHSVRCPMDASDAAERAAASRFIDPLDIDGEEEEENEEVGAEGEAALAAEAALLPSGMVRWCHFSHRAPMHAVHTQHERSSRGSAGKVQPKFSYVLLRKTDATQREPAGDGPDARVIRWVVTLPPKLL